VKLIKHLHVVLVSMALAVMVRLERCLSKRLGMCRAGMHPWHIEHKDAVAEFKKLASLAEQLKMQAAETCSNLSKGASHTRRPGPGCRAPAWDAGTHLSCSLSLANFWNLAVATL